MYILLPDGSGVANHWLSACYWISISRVSWRNILTKSRILFSFFQDKNDDIKKLKKSEENGDDEEAEDEEEAEGEEDEEEEDLPEGEEDFDEEGEGEGEGDDDGNTFIIFIGHLILKLIFLFIIW